MITVEQSREYITPYADKTNSLPTILTNHGLYQQETREYTLPKDMPITSQMRHKGGRNSAQPFWVAVSQGSLPTLPPLRRPESMMTVASSVHKGDVTSQQYGSENSSSQFSLIPE